MEVIYSSIALLKLWGHPLAWLIPSKILRNCFTKEELYVTLMNIFKYDFSKMILCSARVDARYD